MDPASSATISTPTVRLVILPTAYRAKMVTSWNPTLAIFAALLVSPAALHASQMSASLAPQETSWKTKLVTSVRPGSLNA